MIDFRVRIPQPSSHRFLVTLTIPRPAAQQVVSLPVWIPGSYMVREFARQLSAFEATQGGAACDVQALDKTTWRIACTGCAALVLHYEVYAFDTSMRTAFVDSRRGFFNGTSLCLRVHGRESEPQRLTIGALPRGWQVATAMAPERIDAAGRGSYVAADYHELIDHPFELGSFWRGHFKAGGIAHEFVVTGALPSFDGARLLADSQRICEAAIAMWHGELKGRGARTAVPITRYVFLLNAVDDGHGGLEHRASTALIAARRDLPRRGAAAKAHAGSDGALNLLGLISHEYFHTWNVKRLKPAEFAQFDYSRENYTQLLWFFEGFTSYYDDLLLLRAGLIDAPRYLRLLTRSVNALQATPGRRVQSVAEASFDAWVKYYRSDENTPNATVSYYGKGSLIALCLDLSLRAGGSGVSLDDVMRLLWSRSGGGPVDEAAIFDAVDTVAGRRLSKALSAWVHGRDELPLPALLRSAGVKLAHEPSGWAARLGLRLSEGPVSGVQVRQVLRGSPAEAAGVSAGDELLAVDGWRIRKLDEALAWVDEAAGFELLACRDQRILSLRLAPADAGGPQIDSAISVSLQVDDTAPREARSVRDAWLSSSPAAKGRG
jgi:predicted metalloprotease with PDZ domain